MTPDQFQELCRGTARALGLRDPNALFTGGEVILDGVKVGAFHEEEHDPEGVFCYADLGPIGTQANPVELLEEVLAINLSLDGERGEVIGLERDSRHLVLRVRLREDQEPLHEGRLAEELRRCAAQANALYDNALSGVERPVA
ncbi:CesT family type III secretion system chaperone [Hydrogenophaga borbori]|uniref:CesT family type III secretion system chaperone n=1 Tax=Hydrogenophaga borbori TaxID=2294117 RepID=UPI00301DDDD4